MLLLPRSIDHRQRLPLPHLAATAATAFLALLTLMDDRAAGPNPLLLQAAVAVLVLLLHLQAQEQHLQTATHRAIFRTLIEALCSTFAADRPITSTVQTVLASLLPLIWPLCCSSTE